MLESVWIAITIQERPLSSHPSVCNTLTSQQCPAVHVLLLSRCNWARMHYAASEAKGPVCREYLSTTNKNWALFYIFTLCNDCSGCQGGLLKCKYDEFWQISFKTVIYSQSKSKKKKNATIQFSFHHIYICPKHIFQKINTDVKGGSILPLRCCWPLCVLTDWVKK